MNVASGWTKPKATHSSESVYRTLHPEWTPSGFYSEMYILVEGTSDVPKKVTLILASTWNNEIIVDLLPRLSLSKSDPRTP